MNFLDVEAPSTPTGFRLQAKKVFLTYPQANNIELKELFDFLKSKGTDKLVVSEEEHEDGGRHFHALVEFTRKVNTRKVDYFDFNGNHPNIVKPNSPKGTFDYVTKDGNYINDGWDFEKKESITKIVQQVAQEPGLSHNEAVCAVMERGGDRALKLFNQVNGYMLLLKKPSAKHLPLMDINTFNLASYTTWGNAIKQFIQDVNDGPGLRETRMSLWLHGPSRMGKTMMARSLGVHWYMNSMWNAECFDDDAAYGVLDDMPWENGLRGWYKSIMGLQLDVTITDKYKPKSVIKHGRPVIIITNTLPDFTQEERAWLSVNVTFCGVLQPCYKDFDEVMGEAQDPYSVLSSQ